MEFNATRSSFVSLTLMCLWKRVYNENVRRLIGMEKKGVTPTHNIHEKHAIIHRGWSFNFQRLQFCVDIQHKFGQCCLLFWWEANFHLHGDDTSCLHLPPVLQTTTPIKNFLPGTSAIYSGQYENRCLSSRTSRRLNYVLSSILDWISNSGFQYGVWVL